MLTVYKYPFKITDEVCLELPVAADILDVQCQGDTPCLWAIVAADAPKEQRRFRIYGTGHPIEDLSCLAFVATFQQPPFVWHMFEITAH